VASVPGLASACIVLARAVPRAAVGAGADGAVVATVSRIAKARAVQAAPVPRALERARAQAGWEIEE